MTQGAKAVVRSPWSEDSNAAKHWASDSWPAHTEYCATLLPRSCTGHGMRWLEEFDGVAATQRSSRA
jgi:hypothetical protein